ncbi:hypothetical protein BGZ61DRAFT_199952 [Ilyonectria robusta]|uniref:uncharacterized protein n=1 Tax=Ilyonectria robusta TaxID=1079257 RepID=UPI001E8E6A3A|nr:uncharacterized protein BGZ61DRAFT_199952 [Ilyonectria robusta]KAH8722113.1 hypothetical protein BGZ61DRAFT_199952 [Ilyonectria robusta]
MPSREQTGRLHRTQQSIIINRFTAVRPSALPEPNTLSVIGSLTGSIFLEKLPLDIVCDPNTSLSLTYRLLAVLPMYVRASRMRAYRAGPGLLEPASTHPARPAHPFAAHCNLAQKAAPSSKPPCVVGGSRGCGPGLAVPLLLLHRPTHRAKAGTLRGHPGSVIVRSSGAPV